MAQRIIMIVLILIIIVGGGFFAYKELMPPPDSDVGGPVYATKEIVRGDISIGVETMGMLDPSQHGGAKGSGRDDGSFCRTVYDRRIPGTGRRGS